MEQNQTQPTMPPSGPTNRLGKPLALGLIAAVLLLLALLGMPPEVGREVGAAGYDNAQYGFTLQLSAGWQENYRIEETADRIYLSPATGSAWQVDLLATDVRQTDNLAGGYSPLGQTRLFRLSYRVTPDGEALPPELAAVLTAPAVVQDYTPRLAPLIRESFSLKQLRGLASLAQAPGTAYGPILAGLPWGGYLADYAQTEQTLHLYYDEQALAGLDDLLLGDFTRQLATALFVLAPQLSEVAFAFPQAAGSEAEQLPRPQIGYTREGCTEYYGTYLATLILEPQTWLDCIRALPPLGRPRELGAFATGATAQLLTATELRQLPLSSSPARQTVAAGQTLSLLQAAGDYLLVAGLQGDLVGYVPKAALDLAAIPGYGRIAAAR